MTRVVERNVKSVVVVQLVAAVETADRLADDQRDHLFGQAAV